MNAAHLHLVLTHLPVLGTGFALGTLAWGLWKQSQELKRLALGILVLAALVALPTYFTGEPAEDIVQRVPGTAGGRIEAHEDWAGAALAGAGVLGVTALGGLVVYRRGRLLPRWFAGATLAGALVVTGMMTWTASLGGQIRHPETGSGSGSSPRQSHHDD